MTDIRRNSAQEVLRPGCHVRKLYGSDAGRSGIVVDFEDGKAVVMWAPTLRYLDRQRRASAQNQTVGTAGDGIYSDSVSEGPYSARDLELC